MPRILFINHSSSLYANTKSTLEKIYPDIKVDSYVPEGNIISISKYSEESYVSIFIQDEIYTKNTDANDWINLIIKKDNCPPVIILLNNSESGFQIKTLIHKKVYYLNESELKEDKVFNELNLINTEHDISFEEITLDDSDNLFYQEVTLTDFPKKDSGSINRPLNDSEVVVPGYEIIKSIGRGAMSTVFLARRLDNNLEVVLKVMFTRSKEDMIFLRQFMQEYKLISNIDHPNVVTIYERGFAASFAYIAIEYLSKGDLRRRLSSSGINPVVALDYIEQIASGLKAAHALNIIHRDIKPANILFKSEHILTITDFGTARDLNIHPEDEEMNGMIVGTPYYMSPEQGNGNEVDERSDLYSLGIIFYELLIGSKPFIAKSIEELIMLHIHAPIPRLPANLMIYQSLIDGLMAKDPDERFLTAEDVLAGIAWIKNKL